MTLDYFLANFCIFSGHNHIARIHVDETVFATKKFIQFLSDRSPLWRTIDFTHIPFVALSLSIFTVTKNKEIWKKNMNRIFLFCLATRSMPRQIANCQSHVLRKWKIQFEVIAKFSSETSRCEITTRNKTWDGSMATENALLNEFSLTSFLWWNVFWFLQSRWCAVWHLDCVVWAKKTS